MYFFVLCTPKTRIMLDAYTGFLDRVRRRQGRYRCGCFVITSRLSTEQRFGKAHFRPAVVRKTGACRDGMTPATGSDSVIICGGKEFLKFDLKFTHEGVPVLGRGKDQRCGILAPLFA